MWTGNDLPLGLLSLLRTPPSPNSFTTASLHLVSGLYWHCAWDLFSYDDNSSPASSNALLLASNSSIQCYQGSHILAATLGWTTLFVFSLGYPLVSFTFLWRQVMLDGSFWSGVVQMPLHQGLLPAATYVRPGDGWSALDETWSLWNGCC